MLRPLQYKEYYGDKHKNAELVLTKKQKDSVGNGRASPA